MKRYLGGLMLVAVVGCSSPDSGAKGAAGGNGSGGAGGSGGSTKCGTTTATRLYVSAGGDLLRAPVSDGEFVYFFEGIDQIKKIPVRGGDVTSVATSPKFILDVTLRLYLDGPKLYFSGGSALYSVDKTGGTPVALVTSDSNQAVGIDAIFSFDADYIYYGDKNSGTAGESLGTVKRLKKAGGTPEILADHQAGPGAVAFDETHLYWINEGTLTRDLTSLDNAGIGSVPKAGGSAKALFAQTSKDDIAPTTLGDLLVGESELYFSSINLDNFANTNEYTLAKGGGAPKKTNLCITMGAFFSGGALVANCGDRISRFELDTGAETELVCLPGGLESATLMTHDDTTMYFVKAEPDNAAGDTPYAIYSAPLP